VCVCVCCRAERRVAAIDMSEDARLASSDPAHGPWEVGFAETPGERNE
jgi:hypothetical protein